MPQNAAATLAPPVQTHGASACYEPAESERTNWPPRVSRKDAPKYCREVHGAIISYNQFAKLGVIGGGPCFRKQGRFVLYDTEELDRWINERLSPPCKSTAEYFTMQEQARKADTAKAESA